VTAGGRELHASLKRSARTHPECARPAFEFLTGFEGTHIFGSGYDILETTEHTTRFEEDLLLLAGDGLRSFRACIPWHRVEQQRGIYDWTWTDRYLNFAYSLGLNVIADPLHHTSFPEWLQGGFVNSEFPSCYLAFLQAFARRYPWIERYTIINEPFVTAWLCGNCEIWHPHHSGDKGFVPMLLAVAETICRATAELERIIPNVIFVHADSCERHVALDQESQWQADRGNHLRFLLLDLVLGEVHKDHPLWHYVVEHEHKQCRLAWLRDNPAHIDVLGLDYYSHSELAWTKHGRADVHPVVGFKAVALEYAERYRMPIMLSETNLRGTIADRISWLRYMALECESLAAELAGLGHPMVGFCWYPFVDSTDWCSLVTQANRRIDPQGIYWLDSCFERNRSALSDVYRALARGAIRPVDIPSYEFGDGALVERGVRNYLPHIRRQAAQR